MIQVTPVILCGGSGTRLWPLSRTGFPKQFLCLTGKDSLFQQAATRLAQLGSSDITASPPLLVTGEARRFLAAEQLRESGIALGHALLEPTGRNTAPALTLAALAAQAGGEDPVLVVMTPADQTVVNTAAFTHAMQQAIQEALAGTIVILGITPDRPETGYGYIQTTPSLRGEAEAVHPVQRFVEKPDAATAQQYLDAGGYFWNAGMFVLKASVWLKALEQFRPDILQATRTAWAERREDGHFIRPGEEAFKAIPAESIDYAVMEHAPGAGLPIKMVPLNAGWSDLGAWDAVWNVLPKDAAGNAHEGDVLFTDSRNTLVHATSRLVSLVGLQDALFLGNMDAKRDWGHAKDYVEMQWLMLQQEQPEDFVIATGVQYSVRDFVNAAAKELGIALRWEGQGVDEKGCDAAGKCIVAVDPRYFRPTEVETLLGDPSKAKQKLGWTPKISFDELVAEMVREDLKSAERDELVKKHGYKAMDYNE